MEEEIKSKLEKIVKKMGTYKLDLKCDSLELFELFGYSTKRRLDALNTPAKFLETFPKFNKINGYWAKWEQYYYLFH